jgi:hypothetical protein
MKSRARVLWCGRGDSNSPRRFFPTTLSSIFALPERRVDKEHARQEFHLRRLLYDGEEPPELPNLPKRQMASEIVWGSTGKDARLLAKFLQLFNRIEEWDQKLIFFMAQKMARPMAG